MPQMIAPASVPVGSLVYFFDGTSSNVGADRQVTVPQSNVPAFLAAGWGLVSPAGTIELPEGQQLLGGADGLAAAAPQGGQLARVKASTGVAAVLAAAAVDRVVIIGVLIDEVYADGDGAQPTIKLGVTSNDDAFAAAAVFDDAAAAARFQFSGLVPAGEEVIATATAGTGTSTGGMTITAIAAGLPAEE